MSGFTLFAGAGGRVVLPLGEGLLIDRDDGGHLCVEPPRVVWERSELSAEDLTQWSFLVATTGRAMIEALPQLRDGCVNYWEAGNWALNDAASPSGPKTAARHRNVHQHVIGRSPSAANPAWKWGEAPVFPTYADRTAWSAAFRPLTSMECAAIRLHVRQELSKRYGVTREVGRPALAIFDMAGTTVADEGQVPRAFRGALDEAGLSATADQIDKVRGASKREAIGRFVPEGPDAPARADAVYRSFKARLADAYSGGGVRDMAGASALFDALRSAGIRVALNTGFDREITALLLEGLGWLNDAVDFVVCGDDVANGRPAPDLILRAMELAGIDDPAKVLNVGDTILDLRAAASARVGWNVGVLSGAHDLRRLSAEPQTDLAPDISYLRARWASGD